MSPFFPTYFGLQGSEVRDQRSEVGGQREEVLAARSANLRAQRRWIVDWAASVSSLAIRSKTWFHLPGSCWRKRRIVGYHGLSSRSRSQRQSTTLASATHTATPSASQVRNRCIRRDHKIEVFHDSCGVHERAGSLVEPAAQVKNLQTVRQCAQLLRPYSLLQTDELDTGDACERCES